MPYFSIVIPVYNKAKFVSKTITSVLEQSYADYEIILVNDGSTDESEAVISGFKDKRIRYFLKKNEGASAARNFGIEKAVADYICFLDADDYWYPDFLKTMHQYSIRFPEQKVFAAAIEIETSKNTIAANYAMEKTGDFELVDYFQASRKETVLSTSSTVVHKEVLHVVGHFDKNIRSGQDTDLWIRIGLAYPIVFIWKIHVRYIYDAASLSRDRQYLNAKIDFSKFSSLEKTNKDLKIFLDLNRFSLAIKSKLINDNTRFKSYYTEIDLSRLSVKRRFLLRLPSFVLKGLLKMNIFLANAGLGKSVFR